MSSPNWLLKSSLEGCVVWHIDIHVTNSWHLDQEAKYQSVDNFKSTYQLHNDFLVHDFPDELTPLGF